MGAIYNEYVDEGYANLSIGIGVDTGGCDYWKYVFDLDNPVLSDLDLEVWELFSMSYIPHFTILDCSHTVVYTNFGYYEDLILQHINEEIQYSVGVSHIPLGDSEQVNTSFPVTADFTDYTIFLPGYPVLAWSNDGVNFSEIAMTPTRWSTYSAEIPAQSFNTDVYYYLDVQNNAGCNRLLPASAPFSSYHFFVGEDHIPPVVEHNYREQISEHELPMLIEAVVTDNIGVSSVILEYSINDGDNTFLEMTSRSSYAGAIPDQLSNGDIVSYRLIATDSAQAANQTILPDTGYFSTTINDKVPVLVVDRDYAGLSGPVIFSDINDMGLYTEYTRYFPENLSIYDCIFVCMGVLNDGYVPLTEDEAALLRDYLGNGGAVYLEGGSSFCAHLTTVHPFFHIECDENSSGIIESVKGYRKTFTQGLSMLYSANPAYNMDNDFLLPGSEAVTILASEDPVHPVSVMYEHPVYKTIGTSILYGGLVEVNSDDQPQQYLEGILTYFNVIESQTTPTPQPKTPTPTSTPEPEAMAKIILNQDVYTGGNQFNLDLHITNTIKSINVNLFLVLDIQGTAYFFWPDWSQSVGYQNRYLEKGTNVHEDILDFVWPEDSGSCEDLRFWTVMLSSESGLIFGDFDRIEWSYY